MDDKDQKTRPGQGRLFPSPEPHVCGSGPSPVPGSVPAAQVAANITRHPAIAVEPTWIVVAGGRLPAGRWRPAINIEDLAWMSTPLTNGHARRVSACSGAGEDALPVTGSTQREAAELATTVGGRLPTSSEWEWMAGSGIRRYPWGSNAPTRRHANLRGLGPGAPTPVGAFPAGNTPTGIADVAGNVWEWTTTTAAGGVVVRGGSYNSHGLYAECVYTNEIPATITSAGIGLRVVREP